MKKIFIVLMLAVSILSCSLERVEQLPEKVTVWLSSEKPQLDTLSKTHWDGETILWTGGDRICVAAKGNGIWLDASGASVSSMGGSFIQSATSLEEDAPKARFSVPSGFLAGEMDKWQFFGVYPSDCLIDKLMKDEKRMMVRIPSRQIPINRDGVHSFDSAADILVGNTDEIASLESGDSYPMLWQRAVAHLDLDFVNLPYISEKEKIISIVLTADEEAALTGDFLLDYDAILSAGENSDCSNTVAILQRDGNITLESDGSIKNVWISINPQTIKSLKVEINTDKATYSKSWNGISRTFIKNCRNVMKVNMNGAAISGTEMSDDDKSSTFNHSFDISIPEKIVAEYRGIQWKTPAVESSGAVDLHIEVLPLHVFGNDYGSGDYYSVSGYVVMHNAEVYAERSIPQINMCGWYMGEYNLGFQMLDSNGNAVSMESIEFLVTPEPSTTIGAATYTKGSSFSLSGNLTFGAMKKEDDGDVPGWKTTFLGILSTNYTSSSSTTQTLPDQSVEMSTSTDRSISYKLVTNNDTGGYETENIPIIARTDQRMDFSWVWQIKAGNYCAKDYDFGNMRMRVTVQPVYRAKLKGHIESEQGQESFEQTERYSHDILSTTIDLPAMNRIPSGTVQLKNTMSKYLAHLEIYRSGEYGLKKAYYKDSEVYEQNESASVLLREGEYDFVYDRVDGDTGDVAGKSIIRGVKVEAGKTTETTTLDSEVIN
ncbi:MAG: hypothetical protein ACI4TM_01250 [Candidatus Cryptobacteroides sp.]